MGCQIHAIENYKTPFCRQGHILIQFVRHIYDHHLVTETMHLCIQDCLFKDHICNISSSLVWFQTNICFMTSLTGQPHHCGHFPRCAFGSVTQNSLAILLMSPCIPYFGSVTQNSLAILLMSPCVPYFGSCFAQ